jgi:hypothetical protein
MAIYRRGAIYWWRRNLSARPAELDPITIRISLKTACASLAKGRAAALELEWNVVESMVQPSLRPDLTRDNLSRVYHAAYRTQLDRIVIRQAATPMMEEGHAAANLIYAHYFTLLARCPAPPTPDQELLEHFLEEGLTPDEAQNLHMAIQMHRNSPPISHRHIGAYLAESGVYPNDTNKKAVARVVAAAYRNACLEGSALLGRPVPPGAVWPLPGNLLGLIGVEEPVHDRLSVPVAQESQPEAAISTTHPASPPSPAERRETSTAGDGRIDLPISELAKRAIAHKTDSGDWRPERARDVKAAVALFTAANDDLRCSQMRQHHVSAMTALFPRLPTKYGHVKTDLDGGIAAALVRGDELRKEWQRDPALAERNRLPQVGLSAVTHNKHLTWLSSLVTFAEGHGYVIPEINPSKARAKIKKTKGPKRPPWAVDDLHKLFQAPIWTGCAGLWERFSAGSEVFHDAAYWSPLLIATTLGRSDEPNGLMLADVFEDASIPYVWFRDNAYRKLKNGQSDRKIPISPTLIELGFLDHVRAMRRLGHDLLFPEMHGNSGFDHEFYDKVFEPLRKAVFPNGSSAKRGRKDADVHSIRSRGLTLLRDLRYDPGLRQYLAGHVPDGETAASYEDDPEMEILAPLVAALGENMLPEIKRSPLRLRPVEWQRPGAPRGRRRKP